MMGWKRMTTLFTLNMAACSLGAPSSEPKGASIAFLAEAAAKSDIAAGLALYAQLASSAPQGNLAFSPESAVTAFSLLYPGAERGTASALAQGFHFPDLNDFLQQRQALSSRLRKPPELANPGQHYELNMANDVWVAHDLRLKTRYVTMLERTFDTTVQRQDFASQPDESRKRINLQVANETNQRIRDLLPERSVSSDTRLVLTNAIFFLADWEHPFPASTTAKAEFKADDGTRASVDLMAQTTRFPYYEGDGVQAVSLPYVGHRMAMLVLLPRQGGVRELERRLSPRTFLHVASGLEERTVALSLPRFTIAPQEALSLREPLQALGVRPLFCGDPRVDLSSVAEGEDLCVSAAYQKAFVKVDEKGTEAAAATGIVVGRASLPLDPVSLRVDHSALFVIYETETKAPLFLGRLWLP